MPVGFTIIHIGAGRGQSDCIDKLFCEISSDYSLGDENMYFRLASLMTAGLIFLTAPVAAETINVRDITDAKEISERSDEFAKDLTQLGIAAKLKCDLLIGTQNDNGNESFGGICDMTLAGKKPTSIMLCNDTMIGKLTVKAFGFSENKNELTAFTNMNCQPGG
ncbi:hypothetical protein [Brucella sp. NBRC 12953]|uniref:hypothetical protein n=1 Tax=Brucella sp. NBRC 12953 TaxID=3075481 RepID=UPI00333EADC1